MCLATVHIGNNGEKEQVTRDAPWMAGFGMDDGKNPTHGHAGDIK
jgi:hypothetical protein